MNGIPPIGTWVVGFFLDGESAQYPIIMGAIPGYLPKPDNTFTAINMQSTPV
jgi:hypothetical protein